MYEWPSAVLAKVLRPVDVAAQVIETDAWLALQQRHFKVLQRQVRQAETALRELVHGAVAIFATRVVLRL